MIEIIDNLVQVLVLAVCWGVSAVRYMRRPCQGYLAVCCFYACYGLAGLYWLLYYTLLPGYVPVFFVADMGWLAGFVFVWVLLGVVLTPAQLGCRHWYMVTAAVLVLALAGYYGHISNPLYNILLGLVQAAVCYRG